MFKRVLISSVLLAGLVAWQAPAAFPWYSTVSAGMTCARTVHWTASAWRGPTPASRVNPRVGVWASYNGGLSFVRIATGAFDAGDDYSFSGTFAARAGADRVMVKVREEASWPSGGGDAPGPAHTATAIRPAACGTNRTTQGEPTPRKTKGKPKPTPTHKKKRPPILTRVVKHPTTLPFTK